MKEQMLLTKEQVTNIICNICNSNMHGDLCEISKTNCILLKLSSEELNSFYLSKFKEIVEGMTKLTREETIEFICGDCTLENQISDDDCRQCQKQMNYASQATVRHSQQEILEKLEELNSGS